MHKLVSFLCFFIISLVEAKDFPTAEWTLGLYENASASYNNQGLIFITDPGAEFWHVQLTHTGIRLESGHSYRVVFTIQALTTNRLADARIGRNTFPYDAFAEFWGLSVSTTGHTYDKTFIMSSTTTDDARFEFNVGKYSGHILISNVSLTCLDCDEKSNSSTTHAFAELIPKSSLRVETKIYGDVEVGPFKYGIWGYGKFNPIFPPRPVFRSLPTESFIDFVAHGKFGRVIKKTIRKHSKTKVTKGTVRFTLCDEFLNPYPDVNPVDVDFFRNGEENGEYVFQTLVHSPSALDYDPDKHGRLIIFTQEIAKVGIHDDVFVLPIKKSTDRYFYEFVKW